MADETRERPRQCRRLDLVDGIRPALADGERLLTDDEQVAVADVDAGVHQRCERVHNGADQVVARRDERGPKRESRPDTVLRFQKQVTAPVRARGLKQVLTVLGAPGNFGVAAMDEPGAIAALVQRHRAVVHEHAHPQFRVDSAPEEHRLLDLPHAGTPEAVSDGRPAPVLSLLECGRPHEALQHRTLPPVPAEFRRGEADFLAPLFDLLGQHPVQGFANHGASPPVVDDRAGRKPQHVFDQFLVQERQPRLERVRHRRAVLVSEQRRQAVCDEVLQQAQLEVVGDAIVLRRRVALGELFAQQ